MVEKKLSLPPEQERVLKLVASGYSYFEIARATGKSYGATRNNRTLGTSKLIKATGGEEYPNTASTTLILVQRFNLIPMDDPRLEEIKTIAGKKFPELSTTERKIVELMGKGLSNKSIAKEMNYSAKSINNMVSRIHGVTGLKDRAQLVLGVLVSNSS